MGLHIYRCVAVFFCDLDLFLWLEICAKDNPEIKGKERIPIERDYLFSNQRHPSVAHVAVLAPKTAQKSWKFLW